MFPSLRRRPRAQGLAGRRVEKRPWPVTGLLLGLLLWLAVLALLNLGGQRPYAGLVTGQRAPFTVVAQVDFKCEDVARTELTRQQAANEVPPVFQINFAPLNTAIRTLDKLFDRLADARRLYPEPDKEELLEASIGNTLDLLGVTLTPQEALALAPPEQEDAVLEAIRKSQREIWALGIVSPADHESAFQGQASGGAVTVQAADGVVRSHVALEDLQLPTRALDAVVRRTLERLGEAAPARAPLTSLLKPWMAPNLVYDAAATAERRKAARLAVEPAVIRVRTGTTLVEAGESVTSQMLEQLQAHDRRRLQLESPYDRLLKQIGTAGLLMAALIAVIGLLFLLAPDTLLRNRRIVLMILLSLLTLGPARLMLDVSSRAGWVPSRLVESLLPLALSPLLAAPLLGASAAVVIGLWNSLAASILLENRFAVLFLGLVVSLVAALAARDVRRRSHIYRAGILVGLAQILVIVSLGVVSRIPLPLLAWRSVAALGNGLLCAILAILLIPLLEWAFRETTNLTLLELLDMGHPLLQRMAIEAPGTYHHSIVVANLAQAAALEIGANSLLVRVAAYFHDIGKLAKPEFFTENMRAGENPHDSLTPQMSTLVITSHVKEGLTLARRYKLPRCIVDGIEQHHGTGVVSFFYHRARRQQGAGRERAGEVFLPDGDFRYDGPRPESREMAVLALADSVEAAARSLEKPTPARIESLVHELAAAKLRDGQFDHSPLTLSELAAIKRSFVYTLANMLHVRVAYAQDESKPAQPSEPGATSASEAPRAGAPAAAPGRG